jgi:hypothetical protein
MGKGCVRFKSLDDLALAPVQSRCQIFAAASSPTDNEGFQQMTAYARRGGHVFREPEHEDLHQLSP